MYCTYCGKEIENDSKFCCYCGKTTGAVKTDAPKESVRNKVFAFIGFGLGICSFILSLIPFACFCSVFISIPGLVFSSMGLKSSKESFARKGKVFGILGIIFGVMVSILSILILIGMIEYVPEIYDIIYEFDF